MLFRHGETSRVRCRSDRFYVVDGQWWFTTREKKEVGPFSSKEDAEFELVAFLCFLEEGEAYPENPLVTE